MKCIYYLVIKYFLSEYLVFKDFQTYLCSSVVVKVIMIMKLLFRPSWFFENSFPMNINIYFFNVCQPKKKHNSHYCNTCNHEQYITIVVTSIAPERLSWLQKQFISGLNSLIDTQGFFIPCNGRTLSQSFRIHYRGKISSTRTIRYRMLSFNLKLLFFQLLKKSIAFYTNLYGFTVFFWNTDFDNL